MVEAVDRTNSGGPGSATKLTTQVSWCSQEQRTSPAAALLLGPTSNSRMGRRTDRYTIGRMSNPMSPEQAWQIAEAQRRRFNELVDVFDTPQPPEVMARLAEIVSAACLSPGEVVLDVGTGAGVLIPLIENYRPSTILACDLAEEMLARVTQKYPTVRTHRADIALLSLPSDSVDVIFMNAMYGNIADKPRACRNAARMLRRRGRLVVSHPEGRAFVDQLRDAADLFVESLPTRQEFETILVPLGLDVTTYRDEPKLYLMVAEKRQRGLTAHFNSEATQRRKLVRR